MARFIVAPNERRPCGPEDGPILTTAGFDSFTPAILGLGDLTTKATEHPAICAIYDLMGYTNFSKHVEPDLSIPGFLRDFLGWLFDTQRHQVKAGDKEDGCVELHSELPFSAKFMGDGVLFLWPATDDEIANCNVVVYALNTCNTYRTDFLPRARSSYVDPPTRLRCGVARGRVLSVGNGEDYVGACINIASRLQKLGGLGFAVHRLGFDFDSHMNEERRKEFRLRKTELRGIGSNELVWILGADEDTLTEKDRGLLRDPSLDDESRSG